MVQREEPHEATVPAAGAEDSSRDGADTGGEKLEEIVVTAQKRSERLIDTPQSVSVLSSTSGRPS